MVYLDENGTLTQRNVEIGLQDQFYAEVQAQGGGRLDTSALISRLPKGGKQ